MLLAAALLLATGLPHSASAQALVEHSFPQDGASAVFQGLPGSQWEAAPGASASALLFRDTQIEQTAVSLAQGSGAGAVHVWGSPNYRDWYALSAFALDGSNDNRLASQTIDPYTARYLRFQVDPAGDADISLQAVLAGSADNVEAALQVLRPHDWGDVTSSAVIDEIMDRVYSWQWANRTTRQDATGWVTGAFFTGVSALYESTGIETYRDGLVDYCEGVDWTLRRRGGDYGYRHADDHCLGQTFIELYLQSDERPNEWIADVKDRFDEIMASPRSGRQDYNWCDALYMAPPAWVRLAHALQDPTYLNYQNDLWWDSTEFLYSEEWNLYYRDASYFDDLEPNGKPIFWSRGNGWAFAGCARMIQYIPDSFADKERYETLLLEMATRLAEIQGENGMWTSSLLYPEKHGFEPETSGSAFFVYGMAYGVNEGILPAATFGPVIEKGWEALTTMALANGQVQYIQQIGANPQPNNFDPYDKDYGYGAFLLAGTEMKRYYAAKQQLRLAATDAATTPSGLRKAARSPHQNRNADTAVTGDPASWVLASDLEAGLGDWSLRLTLDRNNGFIERVADPFADSSNHVLRMNAGTLQQNNAQVHHAITPIPNGETGTLYTRLAISDPFIDMVFGLSDVSNPSSYGDFESGFRLYQLGIPEARDGGAYTAIGEDYFQSETWYELWMVMDNTTDTYTLYIRGGTNFPALTLLQDGIDFRNGTSDALGRFFMVCNTGSAADGLKGDATAYVDDIHLSPGTNLTRPPAARQPLYTLWGDFAYARGTNAKDTFWGWMDDRWYPWIYLFALEDWLYVAPFDTGTRDCFAWSDNRQAWLWLSEQSDGFYYNYGAEAWQKFPAETTP